MSDTTVPHDLAPGTPEQHAGGPPHEPLGEHSTDHGHHNDPESIRREIRKYLYVFGALAVLTIITVAIAQLHLPTWQAVTLALVVASFKAGLVAAFFMHLISERRLIYAVLLFTVFFFGMLMWGPWHQRNNAEKVWPGYDLNATQPAPADAKPAEGAGAGH